MPKILGAKAGKLDIKDSLMIAGAKVISERLLAKVVGNGSILSGGVKLGGAFAINKLLGGKASNILATAWTVDGAEDLVTAFLGNTKAGGLLGDVKAGSVEII